MSEGQPSTGAFLEVIGWRSFQHYSDRNPPWVKLHRSWLSKYSFTRLSDAARSHIMLLWIVASQNDNLLPNDPIWLQGAILGRTPINVEELIAPDPLDEERWGGFLRVVDADRNLLATRYQSASTVLAPDDRPEEKRKEEKKAAADNCASAFCLRFNVAWDLKRDTGEWLKEMAEEYPAVDLPAAIVECGDWWESQISTGGKKTLKAPSRAIRNWLKNQMRWDKENASGDDGFDVESMETV